MDKEDEEHIEMAPNPRKKHSRKHVHSRKSRSFGSRSLQSIREETEQAEQQKHPLENMVFEGGGVHGIAYIGGLSALERVGGRKNIKRYCGASVGTLMAVMAACNVSAKDMHREALTLTKQVLTGGIWWPRAVYNLCRYWGMYDISVKGRPWLADILQRHTGNAKITFGQILTVYGHEVHLAVYNRTRSQLEILSPASAPDMPVIDVVMAGMSFPGYFMPQQLPNDDLPDSAKKNEDLYIDGGIVDNFPLHVFDAVQYEGGTGTYNPRTMGMRTVSDKSVYFASQLGSTVLVPTNVVEYLEGIVACMVESGQQRHEREQDADRTCFMVMPHDIGSLDFSVSPEDKCRLYNEGLHRMEAYLQKHDEQVPPNASLQ